ncbi:hypothetical protein BTHERMOSOX_1741 [Bathymodiolus thermophilus thioautotrophic gill symbiont]|nr:hypothetical protein BTHERMOSOX_1741 [Bathymodiolus thermophilus thioautotrophic gill symbiont]
MVDTALPTMAINIGNKNTKAKADVLNFWANMLVNKCIKRVCYL